MQGTRVSAVSLQSTAVTDRELGILQELAGLEELDLRDTGTTDAAVGAIARLRALCKLDLGYTQVYWYRGGRDSWQAAGLPMEPVAPPPT